MIVFQSVYSTYLWTLCYDPKCSACGEARLNRSTYHMNLRLAPDDPSDGRRAPALGFPWRPPGDPVPPPGSEAPDLDVDIDRLEQMDARELLRFALEHFGPRAAIGTSLQKTGVVIIDLAHRLGIAYRVFFIDTLLNHDETYALLEQVESRYGIRVERFEADRDDVECLKRRAGQYTHFLARSSCCRVRKWMPMQRALKTLDVWISGLRADQSARRSQEARKASWATDAPGRKILKLNPLLDWTAEDVDRYIGENDVPYNKLYDYVSPYGERFTVIGCVPCHIPIREDLDPRAGKFPWEEGAKECGLHEHGSGI
jgi:phosphoadenylyl-sulfate reductase (thioredoxin)